LFSKVLPLSRLIHTQRSPHYLASCLFCGVQAEIKKAFQMSISKSDPIVSIKALFKHGLPGTPARCEKLMMIKRNERLKSAAGATACAKIAPRLLPIRWIFYSTYSKNSNVANQLFHSFLYNFINKYFK